MGDVDVSAGADLHLNAGTYIVNSFTMNGNASLTVDSGPVIIKIAGVGQSTPVTINGGGISNPGLNPANLMIEYAGTGELKLNGGSVNRGAGLCAQRHREL